MNGSSRATGAFRKTKTPGFQAGGRGEEKFLITLFADAQVCQRIADGVERLLEAGGGGRVEEIRILACAGLEHVQAGVVKLRTQRDGVDEHVVAFKRCADLGGAGIKLRHRSAGVGRAQLAVA